MGGLWNDVYQVCQWVFGQEFPGPESPVSQQAFAVVTAMVGLCAFALVLALVEQVVLEGMEANVKRGSSVYESGHHLILGWCVSQRDLEVVRKMLQQICVAYAPEGGTKVVVLTQRSKLEMEGIFWRCLPADKRYGTCLIFRQGSPLVPSDLKVVGANRAASTVIVSDQSRNAAEADAQAVRCAILLDELGMECSAERDAAFAKKRSSSSSSSSEAPAPALSPYDEAATCGCQVLDLSVVGRQVVVELKTRNALPLLKYACSNRTVALPTSQLNAQRLAKMVKRPVISIVSQQLFNFENRVSVFVHYYPHLVGHRFGELAYLFPDGIVMGLVDRISGKARMAPSQDYVVLGSQALVICRPTSIRSHAYHPLAQPPNVAQMLHSYSNTVLDWERQPGRVVHGTAQLATPALAAAAAASMHSHDATSVSHEWLPAMEDWSKAGLSQVEALRRQVEAGGSSSNDSISSAASSKRPVGGSGAMGLGSSNAGALAMPVARSADPLAEAFATAQATLMVPSEYLQVDEGPERVLVLGWGPKCLMADLIKELDHGLSPLPAGSEVVFANTHNPDDTLGAVLQNTTLDYIKVHHVNANPLQRSSLAAKLDMSTFRCALVLCDELWVDPDSYDGNGIDSLDEPSVLRLDSLVMVTQLNVRKLLEDSRLPPINIICQKVATEGLTRFEDRNRLPLGISVNLNSFSAKMLAQLAVNPLMLYPVTRLGEDAQLTIVDSSAYAGLHEAINFWQLVARCQAVGDVLLGYYAIPDHLDEPLHTVVDPVGMEERCQPRVWNSGDGHLKFIVLRGMAAHPHVATTGSHDDKELETTQRAQWVAGRAGSRSGGSAGSCGSAGSAGSSASSASSTSSTGSSAGSLSDV
ncbi:hypothetical protein OEZ86_011691 [Tetradesmus obliquus]|nr:hypothetical protein OEZ86_011691 [Tetradesmus obliquus]